MEHIDYISYHTLYIAADTLTVAVELSLKELLYTQMSLDLSPSDQECSKPKACYHSH